MRVLPGGSGMPLTRSCSACPTDGQPAARRIASIATGVRSFCVESDRLNVLSCCVAACAAHRPVAESSAGSVSAKMRGVQVGGEARCLRAGCLTGLGNFPRMWGKAGCCVGAPWTTKTQRTNNGRAAVSSGQSTLACKQDRGLCSVTG